MHLVCTLLSTVGTKVIADLDIRWSLDKADPWKRAQVNF